MKKMSSVTPFPSMSDIASLIPMSCRQIQDFICEAKHCDKEGKTKMALCNLNEAKIIISDMSPYIFEKNIDMPAVYDDMKAEVTFLSAKIKLEILDPAMPINTRDEYIFSVLGELFISLWNRPQYSPSYYWRSETYRRYGDMERMIKDLLAGAKCPMRGHSEDVYTVKCQRTYKYKWKPFLLRGRWKKCAAGGDIPEGRSFAAYTQVGHMVYIFGGCPRDDAWDNEVLDDLYSFNLQTLLWKRLPDRGNCPRSSQGAFMFCYGGNIYLHGGGEDIWDATHMMHRYNLKMGIWSAFKTTGRQPKCCMHSGGVYGDKLYIFSGCKEACHGVNILDMKTCKWSKVSSGMKPRLRYQHSCWLDRDKLRLYVYGGSPQDVDEIFLRTFGANTHEMYYFDIITHQWTTLDTRSEDVQGIVPFPYGETSCCTNQESMKLESGDVTTHTAYIFGGYTESQVHFLIRDGSLAQMESLYTNDLSVFQNGKWYYVLNEGEIPRKRAGSCLASWEGKVYILCGYTTLSRDESNLGPPENFNSVFVCTMDDKLPNYKVCAYDLCQTVKYEKLKKCGLCKKVAYCSKSCQASDWKTHKLLCKVE